MAAEQARSLFTLGFNLKNTTLFLILGKALFLVLLASVSISIYLKSCDFCILRGAAGYFHAQKENFSTIENEKSNILFIGDSRIASLLDEEVLTATRSLALPGATAIESYYQLKKFLGKNPKPQKVIIGTSNYLPRYRHYFWRLFVARDFFSEEELSEVFKTSTSLENFPMVLKGSLEDKVGAEFSSLLYQSGFFYLYLDELRSTFPIVQSVVDENNFVYNRVLSKGSFTFDGEQTVDLPLIDYERTSFEPQPTIDHYLARIAELGEEKQLDIYWIHLPREEAKYTAAKRRYDQSYRQHYEGLSQELGIKVIELVDPQGTEDLYFDELHFNKTGARYFSRQLLEMFNNVK